MISWAVLDWFDMIANGRNLIFDLATRRVAHYGHPAQRGHDLAEDAAACEQALLEGLDAIRWIRRADETMRAADYEGIFDYTEDLQSSMKMLLNDWMKKASSVAQSAHELESRGAILPSSTAFREMLQGVRQQIESAELTWPMASSAFSDEPW
jgi:hypothetical protein